MSPSSCAASRETRAEYRSTSASSARRSPAFARSNEVGVRQSRDSRRRDSAAADTEPLAHPASPIGSVDRRMARRARRRTGRRRCCSGRFGSPYRLSRHPAPRPRRYLSDDRSRRAPSRSASSQTAGRGRLGRRWEAPARPALLLSVLLRPPSPRRPRSSPSSAASRAPSRSRAARTDRSRIKWPNDVLVGGRKVAGVLAEDARERVVLGIGLNVNQDRGGASGRRPHRRRLALRTVDGRSARPGRAARRAARASSSVRYDVWRGRRARATPCRATSRRGLPRAGARSDRRHARRRCRHRSRGTAPAPPRRAASRRRVGRGHDPARRSRRRSG